MIEGLTGVVLAGGKSRRFGSNKALADWGCATLLETVVSSLSAVVPKVLVVTKEKGPFAYLERGGVRVIEDLFRQDHPLGGLYTGLQGLKTRHAFVCACDMPLIEPKLIEALWEARADYDAVIPLWQGKRQTLCGIYSKDCAGMIRAAIDHDALGIHKLFDSLKTRFFLEEETKRADPQGRSFMDIDTAEDYARVKKVSAC